MALPALSPEIKAMRLRLRHIHIPDLPPLYAPRFLAPKLRDFIQDQITRMRGVSKSDTLQTQDAAGEQPEDAPRPFTRPQSVFQTWVKSAGPPPTVLSFTRRPTYVLPKHLLEKMEPWQTEYLTNSLKSKMLVTFPEPPGWSPLPWKPFWEHDQPETESSLNPLSHEWPEAGIMIIPCAEPMYFGPGQVSMCPIIDLKDEAQRGRRSFRTKYEYERVLEDTTIEVLKREYGIEAFAIPGTPGVWVESKMPPAEIDLAQVGRGENSRAGNRRGNVRRIATVHASITNDITQWGVSIHVAHPDPVVDGWTSFTNPWMPTRQHKNTTSIAAELAHIGSSPRYESRTRKLELWSQRKSRYLQTYFNKDTPLAGRLYHSMPYDLIMVQDGRREPAPMGLDNRDLSTAWTYEFARQLGMHDGFVDHYGVVDFSQANSTGFPTKTPRPGFMTRSLLDEHWLPRPYDQVDVPSIYLGKNEMVPSDIVEDTVRLQTKDGRVDLKSHDGWMLSWPLWYDTLTRKLDESIAGGPWDTRLTTYDWEKVQAARQMRRKEAAREAKELKKRRETEAEQPATQPLAGQVIQELVERTREMEQALKEAGVGGGKVQELLDNAIQMRLLLENRFVSRTHGRAEGTQPQDTGSFREIHSKSRAAAAAAAVPTPTPPSKAEASTLREESRTEIRTESKPNDKQASLLRGLQTGRSGFVKFTETRPEKFKREKRERGLERAAERRKAQPDAVTARPATPDGVPSFLPTTQQIGD